MVYVMPGVFPLTELRAICMLEMWVRTCGKRLISYQQETPEDRILVGE